MCKYSTHNKCLKYILFYRFTKNLVKVMDHLDFVSDLITLNTFLKRNDLYYQEYVIDG